MAKHGALGFCHICGQELRMRYPGGDPDAAGDRGRLHRRLPSSQEVMPKPARPVWMGSGLRGMVSPGLTRQTPLAVNVRIKTWMQCTS